MKEYISLDFIEQVKLLASRGITINNIEKNSSKLEFISYYKIKELAHPFSKIVNGEIKYENISFDTLITRYYQDKKLRASLSYCIEKVEIAFKTRLAYVLGKHYGAYGYLKFSKWMNREKFCQSYISEKQGNFKDMLVDNYNKGRYDSNHIKEHFKENPDLKKYEIPIWMLTEVLTFGDVVVLYDYMSNEKRKLISTSFRCKHDELESWLKTLKFVRNRCAHNSNVIDLKLKSKPKLKEEWKKYLFFDEKGKSLGALAEVILILVFLVNTINKNYHFNDINDSITKIVNSQDANAIKLGFKDFVSSKNAIKDNGGYIKRYSKKPKKR